MLGLLNAPSIETILLNLVLATLLGMTLGVGRTLAGKTAGMRTYALVSIGSCLFVVTSIIVTASYSPIVSVDQLRVMAGIITGIGFLGAGLIVLKDARLNGLETAASLWVAAGVGATVGYGLYAIAIFTTFLVLFVFTILWLVEQRIKRLSYENTKEVTRIDPSE